MRVMSRGPARRSLGSLSGCSIRLAECFAGHYSLDSRYARVSRIFHSLTCSFPWPAVGELHSRFFKGPYPPVRNVVPKEPKWEKLLAMAGQEVKSRTENLNVLGKTSFVKKDV